MGRWIKKKRKKLLMDCGVVLGWCVVGHVMCDTQGRHENRAQSIQSKVNQKWRLPHSVGPSDETDEVGVRTVQIT